jgi:hypothetical protein
VGGGRGCRLHRGHLHPHLGEDVFASTIQASISDSGAADLDEAEIERSIREINEAIRRSSRKPGS